jgi:hypothetical protein
VPEEGEKEKKSSEKKSKEAKADGKAKKKSHHKHKKSKREDRDKESRKEKKKTSSKPSGEEAPQKEEEVVVVDKQPQALPLEEAAPERAPSVTSSTEGHADELPSKEVAVTVAPAASQEPAPAASLPPKKREEHPDPSKCKFGCKVVAGEDMLAHYQAKHPKEDAPTTLPHDLLQAAKFGRPDLNVPLPVDLEWIPDVERKGEPVGTSILPFSFLFFALQICRVGAMLLYVLHALCFFYLRLVARGFFSLGAVEEGLFKIFLPPRFVAFFSSSRYRTGFPSPFHPSPPTSDNRPSASCAKATRPASAKASFNTCSKSTCQSSTAPSAPKKRTSPSPFIQSSWSTL